MQALGDDDKASIEQTIDDEVLKRQAIEFRSTRVETAGDGGLSVEGELTLVGTTPADRVRPRRRRRRPLTGTAVVKQTDWGMKPYSALFGALKVVDEVEVAIEAPPPPTV